MQAWNPNALISFNKLPGSVKFDISEYVKHDHINQRYFENLEVKIGGFGETYVDFAGYKISVKRVKISEVEPIYRAYF